MLSTASDGILWFALVFAALSALVSLVAAWFAALQAARAFSVLSGFAAFQPRLTALETQQDKTLELQRRLAQRLNLAEGKAAEAKRGRPANEDEEPDMREDPDGHARYWERRLNIGLGKPPLRKVP